VYLCLDYDEIPKAEIMNNEEQRAFLRASILTLCRF
jgi:hypothetical protein